MSLQEKIAEYNQQGERLFKQTKHQEAYQAYQFAAQLQEKKSDVLPLEQLRTNLGLGLGLLYLDPSRKEIETYLEEALALAQKEQFLTFIPRIYNAFGILYSTKGNLKEAIDAFNLGIQADLECNGQLTDSEIFLNLANIFSMKSAHEEAIRYAFKALGIVQMLGKIDSESEAIAYMVLGREYIQLRRFTEAFSYFQKALRIFKEIYGEEHIGIAFILRQMGSIYHEQKKYKEAIPQFKKALQIETKLIGENSIQIGFTCQELGLSLFKGGLIEEAYEYYLQSLQVLKQYPQNFQNRIVVSYRQIGEYHYSKGNYTKALQELQKGLKSLVPDFENENLYSLPIGLECIDLRAMQKTVYSKAKILLGRYESESGTLKDLEAAHTTHEYLLQIVEELRKNYYIEGSQILLSRKLVQPFNQSIAVSYMLYQKTNEIAYLLKGFTMSEQEKVHLLRTSMTDTDAKIKAEIPADLLEKEMNLHKKITQLKQKIAKVNWKLEEKEDPSTIQLKSQLFDEEIDYQKLIRKIEKDYPEYYQFKHSSWIANVEEVQTYLEAKGGQILSNACLLISYFIGEKYIYIFSITSTKYKVHQVVKPSNFEQLVEDFNMAINMVEIEDFVEAAIPLYNLLIAPLELEKKLSSLQSLIMLRHDVLHYLSFDALFFPTHSKDIDSIADFHELDYLVYHFDISYHYSATLLLHNEKRSKMTHQKPATFLGFAPVSFDKNDVYAEVEMESQRGKSKVLRSSFSDAETLGNLPNTATEVNEVYQLFHKQELSAKAYLYGAASKQNLFEEAPKYKYVLIATHGFNFNSDGNLSGIYLARGEESEDKNQKEEEAKQELEEGEGYRESIKISLESQKDSPNFFTEKHALLTTTEAYHLQLEADLVVLSSCGSGIGTLQKGEGMMALHRGFLYAGASNIIFTQFDIPDEMSSILVAKLFEYVLEGNHYTKALRKAKLHILQQKGMSPQDWAAFALIGV